MTQDVGFEGMLIGAGALNQDQYTDLLFYVPVSNRLIKAIGSSEGFSYHYLAMIPGMEAIPEGTSLFFGDFDADGTDELILVDKLTVMTYEFRETDVTPVATTTLPFATNVDHIHIDAILPLFGAGGDVTGDGVDDLLIVGKNQKTGRDALYSLVYPTEAPAYDYSSHIIKTEDEYILYTGGLCIDYNTDVYKETAADHIMAYTSKDGLVWHRNLDAACFFLGNELGVAGNYEPGDVFTEKWWMGNTMEPEVLYVDGTYYMYYQCENYRLDKDGVLMGADRIGVATSKDGIHFDRKTDKPVIITSDEYACFTHEEVIYVPDDPNGKCFWMYVRYVHNNRAIARSSAYAFARQIRPVLIWMRIIPNVSVSVISAIAPAISMTTTAGEIDSLSVSIWLHWHLRVMNPASAGYRPFSFLRTVFTGLIRALRLPRPIWTIPMKPSVTIYALWAFLPSTEPARSRALQMEQVMNSSLSAVPPRQP